MIKLTIPDEVNVRFEGLTQEDTQFIINKTSLFVKGYFSSVAFKKGLWNGKASQFSENGSTFHCMLDKIQPLLEARGYNLDRDFEIVDERQPYKDSAKHVTEDFLKPHGITLRYYQLAAINAVIDKQRGILEVATAGGKTLIASALAKVYDKEHRCIVVVPNDNLGRAMTESFEKLKLNVGFINKDVPMAKREEEWESNRHIVVTYQTLNHNKKYLKTFGVVIQDEVHIMGDVMKGILMKELAHAPIRVGMTGTLPEDKQKKEVIFCRIGGELLYNIETNKLANEGFVAKCKVEMVKLEHNKKDVDAWLKKKCWNELPWSYELETKFLNTNKKRLETIADFIKNVSTENTLVLCTKEIGRRLAEITGLPFIDGETDPDARLVLYEAFKDKTDVKLLATFGTVGTGISVNNIFCGVLIDSGKDSIRILQGIGRMLRLDTEGRNFVTIYDVWSGLKYSSRHKNQRIKLYKQRGIEYDGDMKVINKTQLGESNA